jgi:small subunit ribosomal protein S5
MNEQETKTSASQGTASDTPSSGRSFGRDNRSRRGAGQVAGRGRRGGGRQNERPVDEFEQRIVDIARVTRVMAGGKRMRFRACVAIGDKKGKVAIGLAKGADVTLAVAKAVNQAKKDMVIVPIVNQTIPHSVNQWFGAAHVLLKPAAVGRGIIGGGIVRTILELSGINNVTSKILGTNNKVNNAKCVIEALKSLRAPKKQSPKEVLEKKKDEATEKVEKKTAEKAD